MIFSEHLWYALTKAVFVTLNDSLSRCFSKNSYACPPPRLQQAVDGRGTLQEIRADGRGNPVHRIDDSPDGIEKRKQS